MTGLGRVFWAFFVRDFTMVTSYRVDFLMRLGAAVFPLFVLYLPAKLIGDIESTKEYGGFLPFSVIGVGLMNFFMASYGSFAGSLRGEQTMGTLESVLMTPISVPLIVLASSTWAFVWSTGSAILFIGGGALLYDIPILGSKLLALVLVALTVLVFVSLGILSASFVMVWKRGDPMGPIVSVLFFLLGGVVYPTSILPGWVESVAQLLPITHASHAVRAVLIQGRGFGEIFTHFLVLLGYVLVLLPASLYAFSRAVRRATREGTLLQY